VSRARVGRVLVLLALAASSVRCASTLATAKSSRRVDTPDGSYEVTTCRGVNQAGMRCASGVARRFEGALVCKLDTRPWPEQPSPELCTRLPRGCKHAAPGIGTASVANARCSEEDPDCGPLVYDRTACLEEAGYVWDGPRRPVGVPGGGECMHDGDCVTTDECVSCQSRVRLGRERLVMGCGEPFGREWKRTYCGCVQQQCGFFRQ
jgi:hypothetical protein